MICLLANGFLPIVWRYFGIADDARRAAVTHAHKAARPLRGSATGGEAKGRSTGGVVKQGARAAADLGAVK